MRSKGLASSVAKAAVFCGVFYVVTGELIALNTIFFASVPWSLFIATAFTGAWIGSLGRSWSGYRVLAMPGPTRWLVAYIVLSALACVLIASVQGALFSVRWAPLSLSNNPGPLLATTYALVFPSLAAVAEEVGFRGILQGNLETSLGSPAGFLVAGTLFVAAHAISPAFVAQLGLYIGLALAAGAVAARTQSVAPGMWIHLLANTCFAALPLAIGPISLRETPRYILVLVGLGAVLAAATAWWSLDKLASAREA